ncbi:MAG: TSUP family transporter [Bdellovibrionota bacterium]
MTLTVTFICCLGGLLAGFVDAIAGGGGIIVLPMLLLTDIPPTLVLGTNKLIGTTGTVMAVWSFVRGGKVNREMVTIAAPFTAVGACLGVFSVALVPPSLIKPAAMALTVVLAVYFFVRPQLGLLGTFTELTPKLRLVLIVGAFLLGFYDGVFGPGTGAFLTFLFVRLLGLDFVSAAANTKVLNLTSNIVALSLFIARDGVLYSVGLPMAAACMAGGYFGAHFAMRKGAGIVRWLFLVMAVALVIKMLLT